MSPKLWQDYLLILKSIRYQLQKQYIPENIAYLIEKQIKKINALIEKVPYQHIGALKERIIYDQYNKYC